MTSRKTVGVCIGPTSVSAVLTARGLAIVSATQLHDGSAESVARALRTVVGALGLRRSWRRIACHIAVEPALAQVKRITDLPAVSSARERFGLLSLSSSEHFLGSTDALAITVGDLDSDGVVWAMALENTILDVIEREVYASGLVLRGLSPAIDVLAASTQPDDGIVRLRDDAGVTAFGSVANGRLADTWRAMHAVGNAEVDAESMASPSPITSADFAQQIELARLATTATPRGRFGERARRRNVQDVSSSPLVALTALAASMTLAALLTPGMRAYRDADRVEAAIGKLAPSLAAAASLREKSDSLARVRNEIASFRRSGVHPLNVLAQLTDVLSDEAYLVALNIDSVSVQATAVAPRAADLLDAFAHMEAFDSVSLVGAVSRENSAGTVTSAGLPVARQLAVDPRVLERVTLRFVRSRVSVAGPANRNRGAVAMVPTASAATGIGQSGNRQ